MSTSKQFNSVMREWVDLFMTRSWQDLARFIKRADLSMAQYSTLMRLHHLENCGVSDIGEKLGITNAAASQLVDKLVQAGLVARTEALHDRRVRQVAITERGRKLVKSSLEARVSWTRGLGESLPASKREAIIHALSQLIEAAQGLDQPAA